MPLVANIFHTEEATQIKINFIIDFQSFFQNKHLAKRCLKHTTVSCFQPRHVFIAHKT